MAGVIAAEGQTEPAGVCSEITNILSERKFADVRGSVNRIKRIKDLRRVHEYSGIKQAISTIKAMKNNCEKRQRLFSPQPFRAGRLNNYRGFKMTSSNVQRREQKGKTRN